MDDDVALGHLSQPRSNAAEFLRSVSAAARAIDTARLAQGLKPGQSSGSIPLSLKDFPALLDSAKHTIPTRSNHHVRSQAQFQP